MAQTEGMKRLLARRKELHNIIEQADDPEIGAPAARTELWHLQSAIWALEESK